MQTKLTTVVLFGLLLMTVAACGSSGSDSDRERIAELEEQLGAEQEARREAEEAEQEAERQRQAEEQARREAEEAEQEAERQRQAEEQARREAEEAEQEAERERQQAEEQRQEEEERRQAAEAARAEAERERREAEQAASRAQAKAAFDGLGGSADDGTRSDPGTVTVTPKYGQAADVTTSPVVDFGSPRRSSSGRWSITTLSNDGSTHKDDLVVYSDLGGPSRELIEEVHSGFSDVTGDTTRIMITIADATHASLIASPQFPGGGITRTYDNFTIDSDPDTDGSDGDSNTRNDYDTVRISPVYFDGASGTLECTGTCTIQHLGPNNYSVGSSTWTFKTSKTARVLVDDTSYMYFGWWMREQKSDEALSFEMFSGGMHPVSTVPVALTGTATYTGAAVGQYAIYQPLGTQTASGSFTARANLTANFGTATAEGTLSGRVTNFSNASDWSVTLNSQTISSGAVARADDSVSWTIGGNTEDGGGWGAQFFYDVSTSTGYPEGVAGTFDAKFADVGRMIGAFGAHCPTSTCPRN